MEPPANVPHDGRLSAFVSLSVNLAADEQLVKEASSRDRHPLNRVKPVLLHALLRGRRVQDFPRNVQISCPYDPFAHGDQVAYSRVEDTEKTGPVVCAGLISLCGTVGADEDEGRKF